MYQNRSGPDLTSAPSNQDEAGESGGGVAALVVTEADQVSPETETVFIHELSSSVCSQLHVEFSFCL